ncbi:MAG: hypothetical protein FVQ84_09115 [Planctomycetes bacterium]|nr:hypothetical protein [Planctomycetota bacterium]
MKKPKKRVTLKPTKEIQLLRKRLLDYGITESFNNDNGNDYLRFLAKHYLPEDVMTYVRNKTIFLVVGDTGGTGCCTWVDKPVFLICIYRPCLDEDDSVYSVYLVAHEIAHAWLKHREYGLEANEQAANDKVKEWGIPKIQRRRK